MFQLVSNRMECSLSAGLDHFHQIAKKSAQGISVRSQYIYMYVLFAKCDLNIKPDTPINVYTRFCLNTAKSKFSLVSPVAVGIKTHNFTNPLLVQHKTHLQAKSTLNHSDNMQARPTNENKQFWPKYKIITITKM